MGDLTKNISRHEVACQCHKCCRHTVDYETVVIVQDACDHFAKELGVEKVVLDVRSGNRCCIHNRKVGGSTNSQHKFGTAMDIAIKGVEPKTVFDYINGKYPDRLGLGLYKTFVHVDTRKGKARW